jgi:hypothetical protein
MDKTLPRRVSEASTLLFRSRVLFLISFTVANQRIFTMRTEQPTLTDAQFPHQKEQDKEAEYTLRRRRAVERENVWALYPFLRRSL